MSKTKKRLFYSVIVAVAILLAFVAVTVMTAPDGTSVIAEAGTGQSALSTVTVAADDSAYGEFDALTSLGGPGTVADSDIITNASVSDADPILDASGLEAALKTGGKYYLLGDISINASTSNSSAAAGGTFSGVLYGNGHTVTVTVPQGTFTSSDYKNYGFLVKSLSGGTIRDLNLVIQAGGEGSVSFGKAVGNRSKQTMNIASGTTVSQYIMQVGGIAGEMTSGLIHNCTVTYSGNIRFIINGLENASSSSIAYGGDNAARIFGGMVGGMSGGIISYSTLNLNGQVYNTGAQTNNGTNHLFVITGGIAGIVEGSTTFRKITVQGGGKLVGQVNTFNTKGAFTTAQSSTDAFTGGIIGYVTGYGVPNINGVYLNLTFSSSSGDSDVFEAASMSDGFTGSVKTYYTRTGGVTNKGYKNQYDSIQNDAGGNVASSTYVSEMRTSYGIGAVETSGINNVSFNNVYVSPTMANVIQNHHPYAMHEIQYGQSTTANYTWTRWNWTYTSIDAASLGNTAIFAPTTDISKTATASDVSADTANGQRAIYFRLTSQGTSNFVYSITQGTSSNYDLFESAGKTYDKSGTVYVPVLYTGFKSNVTSTVKRDGMNLTDTSSSAVSIYENGVSAETGSWLYMDFDMSRSFDGTDRYSDGYSGSGDTYTYAYNGNTLYVPAFAGYKTTYGSGDKVSLSQAELNSIGMSTSDFSLSSSYTIASSQTVNYSLSGAFWSGAGNVGTYTMTYGGSGSSARFISKDGSNYYCSFRTSYPSKTISVTPYSLTINWYTGDMVYDGTGKKVVTSFADLPSGTTLGNSDGANLDVIVAYSATNENLLMQNKPYHAGDYTATATLTYGGTTENVYAGNFTLSNPSQPFTVGKVQMSLKPATVTSTYGDNHSEILASASVSVSGNWVSDDASYFNFTVRTVDETVGFATTKGSYPTTVEASLKENATAELLTDYEFSVEQGTLVINERKINGVLTINNGIYNGFEFVATLTLEDGVKVSTDKVYDLEYIRDSEVVDAVINAGNYLIRITPEENKYTIGTIVIDGKDELYLYGETCLVIEKRSVDIELSFGNGYVYDGANKVTDYTVQSQEGTAGVIEGEDAGLTLYYNGETQAVMPATYTTIAVFSNNNYMAGTITGGTFTIEKAELEEIRIDSASAVYDGTGKNIVYTLVGVADEQDLNSLVGTQTVTYNRSVSLPVNADVYSVEITVAEGAAYKEKSLVTTFTIEKADITFVPETTMTYTGKNIEPAYSITAPGMTDASSLKTYVTATHTNILNATNYDVTLEFAGTANYNALTENYTLTVARADLVVDVADGQTLVYNRQAQLPVYDIIALVEGDSYGAVTLSVEGSKVMDGEAKRAGDYTFKISVAESTNYNAVEKTVSFTIEKYELKFIGASEQFVTVIKDDGVTEVTDIDRYVWSLDVDLIDETGQYTFPSSMSYLAKVDGTSADQLTFENGKAVFTVEFSIPSIDTENYLFDFGVITVTVLDASITITVNGVETTMTSVTFGDALAVSASGSYGGNEAEEVQDVTWYSAADGYTSPISGQPTDAGDYMAVFRYTFGADSNYVTRTLYITVSPKAVTVTLDGTGVNITYGDEITEASFAGATYTTDAGNLDLTVAYSTNAVRYSDVGSYSFGGEVTAVTDGNTGNYVFTVVPGTFNIVRKTVYVKADDVSAVYGDEVILSGFKVYTDDGNTEWSGYAGAAQLKVNLSVQSGILVVGTYDIGVGAVTGGNPNYNVVATTVPGTLSVSKRSIEITANDVKVIYGDSELPSIGGSITGGNLVNGDTLGEITGEWIGSELLGTLDANEYLLSDYVTLSAALESMQTGINYDITFSTATKLVVSPKNVTIVFVGWQSEGSMSGADNTVTYNAASWIPTTNIEGVIEGDAVEIEYDKTDDTKNAGLYVRTLYLAGEDAGNYVAENYVAVLTILPYKTEITVDETSYTYTYGDTRTAVTQSVRLLENDTDNGTFVHKCYVGTNTGVTGTQINWDDVWNAGTYTVVVSYQSGNYEADPVNVTITVNKKQIAKTDPKSGGDLGEAVYSATNFAIDASTVADLGAFSEVEDFIYVVYMLGDSEVSVVRNAGEYTIDLRMTENVNYEIEGGGESLLNYPATYTVLKADAGELRFSLTYTNKVYSGYDMTDYIKSVIAISGVNGELVTGAQLTLTVTDELGSETEPLNSGVYKISVTATDMTNYEDMTSAYEAGSFTIDKVTVTIDVIELPDGTVTYDSTQKTIAGQGIQQSAVLKNISYEYSNGTGFVSDSGVTDAGVYTVKMTILFDKLNTRFSSDVSLDTVQDEVFGEVYKYEASATLTVGQAIPEVGIDTNTCAYYFDGYDHAIEFVLSGVGADGGMNASYDASAGAGQTVTVDGLGTFTVTYFKDASYSTLLTGSDGAAVLPLTVLSDGGKTLPYYAKISFVSSNPNYKDNEFRSGVNDMTLELLIIHSIVNIEFGSLSVPYGQLASVAAANEYVNGNMKYTYTVNDEGSNSVNYDPEAMLEISYNLSSFAPGVGSYDIFVSAQAAKAEYADSVTVVIKNAGSIKLNVTAADVTDEIKAAFTDVNDTYGNKTYTATDFAWTVKDKLNYDVAYTVEYNGSTDFAISDAGSYVLTVRIPAGNFKEWTGSVKLTIAQVGVDVVWTMDGQPAQDGTFTMTYNGQPAPIVLEVVGATGVAAHVVYVNSEGAEIEAPYAVGTYSAKAVLDNSNYYVNDATSTATVTIEAIVLDEETIRSWIKDDSDVYGSVQGIDITGLPEGFGATSIVYTDGVAVYDMTTVKSATVGTYDATVTVSNGSSSGSTTFKYTVTKRVIVFTVSVNGTAGKKITADDVTLKSDKSLASGDSASVTAVTFTDAYSEQLSYGVYDMADYVASVTVGFNRNADCYEYSIVKGEMILAPTAAPEVAEISANYNTVTVKFTTEGLYAYKVGARGNWIEMSTPSDTLIVTGLKADTDYTVYVAYAGFTSVSSSKSVSTTADPAVLSEMIDEIMEGGLTIEKQEQYDSILAYYETIAESDRAQIQAEYDALVAQFGNLGSGGTADVIVIVVCAVCLALIVASIAGVIVAAVMRKRRNDNMIKNDGSLV